MTPTMALPLILLGVGLHGGLAHAEAGPCDAPLKEMVEQVQTKGSEVAYRCLSTRADAGAHLLETLVGMPEETAGRPRVQRALALYQIERLDGPVDPALFHAVNTDDRRLIRDAIYARRGRRSPAERHHLVFSMFEWYQPDERFNNGRLTQMDRENIAMVDDPPAPAPELGQEPAASALPNPAPEPATQVETWCGCSSSPNPVSGLLLLLMSFLSVGVRRLR